MQPSPFLLAACAQLHASSASAQTTERVSVGAGGAQGDAASVRPSISADGRYVTFYGGESNLVPGDTNGTEDVFVRDRLNGTTARVSVGPAGAQANGVSQEPSISADGRRVAFHSSASDLVAGDSNGEPDVFVRELDTAPVFSAVCFGDGSGAPCGCGNEAPLGSGSGCRNGLGVGATLSASGTPSVTNDTLVLHSQGVPAQPGLFFQGDDLINGGGGTTFGDGIRCCGMNVVRLEVAIGAGPEPTSTRTSIPLSQHPQQANLVGTTKCYQHWYRDPSSSPCGASFNLSNAVRATWQP